MKKLFYVTLVTSMLLSSTTNVLANQQITVVVDGKIVSYDPKPVIQSGSTLIPLRQTFEALNADVKWNGVTSTKDDTTVSLVIGNKNAIKNGKTLSISVAPKIVNGSTYVPLRFIAESFGADVEFFPDTQFISIISEPIIFTDYVPYSTGSLETLANDILKGNVVKIKGQYYATPEYATSLVNTHTAYTNTVSGAPKVNRFVLADLDTSQITWTTPDSETDNSNLDGIVSGSSHTSNKNNNFSSDAIVTGSFETDKSNLDGIITGSSHTSNKNNNLSSDSIVTGSLETVLYAYDYANKPWISKYDLNFYLVLILYG